MECSIECPSELRTFLLRSDRNVVLQLYHSGRVGTRRFPATAAVELDTRVVLLNSLENLRLFMSHMVILESESSNTCQSNFVRECYTYVVGMKDPADRCFFRVMRLICCVSELLWASRSANPSNRTAHLRTTKPAPADGSWRYFPRRERNYCCGRWFGTTDV